MPVSWFRQRLRALADCGIHLAPGMTVEDVKQEFDCSFVPTTTSYEALLCVLGDELDGELVSHDVFYLDTECIYESGDYVAIAERVKLIAAGALPMEQIRANTVWDDYWVAFRLDDQDIKIDLSWRGDWVDWSLFSYFAELLDAREAGVQLARHEMLQDCLLGCFSPTQLDKINEELTLNFQWVD
jgi:hypothetical protein